LDLDQEGSFSAGSRDWRQHRVALRRGLQRDPQPAEANAEGHGAAMSKTDRRMPPFAVEFAEHIDKFLGPVVATRAMNPEEYQFSVIVTGVGIAAAIRLSSSAYECLSYTSVTPPLRWLAVHRVPAEAQSSDRGQGGPQPVEPVKPVPKQPKPAGWREMIHPGWVKASFVATDGRSTHPPIG
jgi:hypothetical protein